MGQVDCFLFGMFRLFIFSVLIDQAGLESVLLLFVFCLSRLVGAVFSSQSAELVHLWGSPCSLRDHCRPLPDVQCPVYFVYFWLSQGRVNLSASPMSLNVFPSAWDRRASLEPPNSSKLSVAPSRIPSLTPCLSPLLPLGLGWAPLPVLPS